MLPCFSQGGCLCGAVAVEGSVICVCMPSSSTVCALVLGVSAGVATACRALFAAMLVSGVPAAGSEVLRYLFVLEEDHDLVAFQCVVIGECAEGDHYAGGGFALALVWVYEVSWGLGQ
jgi:hypothetical protein